MLASQTMPWRQFTNQVIRKLADEHVVPKLANSRVMKMAAKKTYEMVQASKQAMQDVRNDPSKIHDVVNTAKHHLSTTSKQAGSVMNSVKLSFSTISDKII